jgi:hypothetical protein
VQDEREAYIGRLEQEVTDLRKVLRVVRDVSTLALSSEVIGRSDGGSSGPDR